MHSALLQKIFALKIVFIEDVSASFINAAPCWSV